ncbi:MAG: response regulator, partial [Candidatus Nitrosopolaris sp.]
MRYEICCIKYSYLVAIGLKQSAARSFNDASQALENFMTGIYDLVILHVKMPEMDGFSFYEKIKKLDGKVMICFLTAAGDAYYETLKKRYPNIDENCVIHKPVDNESL